MRRKALLFLALIISLVISLVVGLVVAAPVLAQLSATHDPSWHVIGGGGGRMESGSHTLQGMVGQAVTGSMSGDSHTLCSGFWCDAERAYRVYLPLVLKD